MWTRRGEVRWRDRWWRHALHTAGGITPPTGPIHSKQLTEEGRDEIFEELMANKDIEYGVCVIDQDRIDEINILERTMEAMTKSARGRVERGLGIDRR